jgi:adenylylsulfate kinase
VERKAQPAFAIWITGLPASGKSTLARALKADLAARGVDVAVLESDALRQVVSDHPQYGPRYGPRYGKEERDAFYRLMAYIGVLLVEHGVPVVFDATANLRRYRDQARQQIDRFLEVYVECPLDTCIARDPKGIYRQAREGAATSVPGLQAAYEPPEAPEVVVREHETPTAAAERVIAQLVQKRYL